ncbi:MAG TPA: LuxR C-terminal-related transcriptional regulator [Candidatus Dormibacteraeota bacterium]|nr:LuxR C-terminal-related transcriptional regulator [Candidatus Dormibacteraeota bacterium]
MESGGEGLLGYEEGQVLGARCWRLLCGTDACGNRLCRPNCWVAQAVRHREPLHRFPVNLRAADGTSVCAQISILVLRPQGPSERRAIVHVLNPCRGRKQGTDIEERQSGWRDGLGKTLEAVDPAAVLSTRELEILRLLAEGSDTHETAHALFISVTTVRNHIQHILAKLGAHSRLAAVSAAKRRGII